jgi:cellulase/cellobiase CelA1
VWLGSDGVYLIRPQITDMDPFVAEQQIEEVIPYDWDDEETKFEVEDYYDDLAAGLPLDSSYEF